MWKNVLTQVSTINTTHDCIVRPSQVGMATRFATPSCDSEAPNRPGMLIVKLFTNGHVSHWYAPHSSEVSHTRPSVFTVLLAKPCAAYRSRLLGVKISSGYPVSSHDDEGASTCATS